MIIETCNSDFEPFVASVSRAAPYHVATKGAWCSCVCRGRRATNGLLSVLSTGVPWSFRPTRVILSPRWDSIKATILCVCGACVVVSF